MSQMILYGPSNNNISAFIMHGIMQQKEIIGGHQTDVSGPEYSRDHQRRFTREHRISA